jgi:hypothetical protein
MSGFQADPVQSLVRRGRTKRNVYAILTVAFGLLLSPVGEARAKVLELWVQGQGGGIYGLYGAEDYDPVADDHPVSDDFFKSHRGGSFGAQVGIELFFVDAIIDFQQFYDENGLSATLTCFMLGFDWDFALSQSWEVTPYGMGGFAFATFNNDWLKEDYQINRADLEARGAVVRLGARLEYKLHEMFRLGVDGGIGYHYILQEDKLANDLEGHSHGFHAYIMGMVRFQWEPFKKDEKDEADDDDVQIEDDPVPLEDPVKHGEPAGESEAEREPTSATDEQMGG